MESKENRTVGIVTGISEDDDIRVVLYYSYRLFYLKCISK